MLTVSPYSTPEGVKYGVYEDYKLISKLYPTEKEAQIQLLRISFDRKEQNPNPGQVQEGLIDPNQSTYLKLQYLAQGILSGQVTNAHVEEKHLEVIVSFESYYIKKGYLTEKQLGWCKTLVGKYSNIIIQLMKTGIKPVEFPTHTTTSPEVVDHRKYERVVEFDEPKKPSRRGRLIKEDE